MVNIHTWTRLTRFDLQHLSISLGNAALEELSSWPVNGDGRTVKALTEQITRTLDGTLDRRDLNYSFDIIEDVIFQVQGNWREWILPEIGSQEDVRGSERSGINL